MCDFVPFICLHLGLVLGGEVCKVAAGAQRSLEGGLDSDEGREGDGLAYVGDRGQREEVLGVEGREELAASGRDCDERGGEADALQQH